ncbi:MAG: PAS domain S-box protein, partial [Proteobacteria bacterium]|nr:PAS domain S-box protein [Pseudomonadota bacterium]
MEKTPLYNTRIIKIFAEYISEYHPLVDIVPILDYAGITTYQLDDEAHWFTQRQVDRFYEILVKTIGDPDLARKAGQCASFSKAGGAVSQYTLGFMTPSAAYTFLGKLYPHMSRGSTIKTRKVSSTKVEVVAIQNPGVTEKPYQCENRLGTFEGIAKLFTNELAKIEHTTCMHISHGDRCIYNITWKTTPSFIWKRIANYSYLLCLIICLILFFALPGGYSAMAIFSLILVVMGISLYQVHLEKNELATSFKNHCDTSSSLLDEINTRYNNAILVREIGKATSMIPDIDNLLPVIMKLIEKHLDFNHGMIMLADSEKTQLIYKAGFGNDPKMMTGSVEIKYHIDKPESKSAVIKAFLEQKSCLIDDINKVEVDFPDRSKNTFKHRGINLFMCVPIVFENESLGVLMVDNTISKRALLESDMSLMAGTASQIAVSITNASYFLKMRQSEERFRELAESLPETVYEADTQGTLTFANGNAFDRFGYTPQDFARGLNALDMVVPEDHGRALDNFQRVMKGEHIDSIEYTFRRNDGGTFSGIMHSTVIIHDGKPAGLRGIMIDNTRRKRIEEALRESEENYRRLYESSPAVLYQVDFRTGKFLKANDIACEYFGCSHEEIISHSPYDILTDESKQLLLERLNKMSLGEKVTETPEYEVIDKNGRRWWVQLSSKNIYDSEGLMGADVVGHDITSRKRAEEELRASQQQLRSLAGRLEQIREEERVMISREIHDVMGGGLTGLKMD